MRLWPLKESQPKRGDGWLRKNPYQRGPAANAAQEDEELVICRAHTQADRGKRWRAASGEKTSANERFHMIKIRVTRHAGVGYSSSERPRFCHSASCRACCIMKTPESLAGKCWNSGRDPSLPPAALRACARYICCTAGSDSNTSGNDEPYRWSWMIIMQQNVA